MSLIRSCKLNDVADVIRETKEESGMNIMVNKLFCVSSNTSTYQGYNGYGIIPTKVVMGFTCKYIDGEFHDSDETTELFWVSKDKVLDFLVVPDFKEKYKAYLNFEGDVLYLEYITKPEYNLKLKASL